MADTTRITVPASAEPTTYFRPSLMSLRFTALLPLLSAHIEAERDLAHVDRWDTAFTGWLTEAERSRSDLDAALNELPPGSHQLWSFPDMPREERCRHAKVLGLAGECLVDSILLRYGLSVMRLPEFTAIDRLILHPEQILRLQVKTTTVRQNGAWFFNAHHGYGRSPQGLRPYEPDAFDLLALVVLPQNAVCEVVPGNRTLC